VYLRNDTVYLLKETAYLFRDTPYKFDNLRILLYVHYKSFFSRFICNHLQHPSETLYGSGIDAVANGCK
ncbi:MAG: hypothetical protein ACRCX1_07125, partial [Bacteroidales bacterium]